MRRTERPGLSGLAGARSDTPWGLPDRAGCAFGPWASLGRPNPLSEGDSPWRLPRGVTLGLATLLVVAVAAGLAWWGAGPPRADAPGNDLRADVSSSKLKNTSAEAPATAPPPLIQEPIAPPADRVEGETVSAPPVTITPAEPPLLPTATTALPAQMQMPPELEQPTAPPLPTAWPEPTLQVNPIPVMVGSSEETDTRVPQPQESFTMMRIWKRLAIPVVLATALSAAPALAAEEPKKGDTATPTDAQVLVELQKQMKDMQTSLKSLMARIDQMETRNDNRTRELEKQINLLNATLENLRGQVAGMSRPPVTPDTDLREELVKIRKDLTDLGNRLDQMRTSLYPPGGGPNGGGPTDSIPVGTARIRLVNTYGQPVTVILNGRSYELAPFNGEVTVTAQPGNFSYEVVGIRPLVNRTLRPNETFTITVHP